jgi:hypothetical protein
VRELERNQVRLREMIPDTGLRQLLGIIVCVFAMGVSAQSETLSGTVIDPQQRVIVGATVTLTCGSQTDTLQTDGRGSFTFTRQAFLENCKVRAVYPNFAALELAVDRHRSFTLQLRLAELKQTVTARTDKLLPSSLTSVSLSADDLREISTNGEDLLAYAKQMAGITSGSDSIYVDGMPADHLPPADRIDSISINADPFSAEYSDGDGTHIDISTKIPDRKFGVSSAGVSLGTKAPDGLNSSLSSTSKTAILGLTGPVPYLPLAFTGNASYTESQSEQPILASVPSIQGISIAPVNAATATDSNGRFELGTDYSRKAALRVNATFSVFTARETNMNVEEITVPQAGSSQDTTAYEFRTAFSAIGQHYIDRGGISADWSDSDMDANSSLRGVSISGAFIAGGADINIRDAQWNRWTFKNVLQSNTRKRNWSAGATVSRRADEENIIPNSFGQIYFDNLADYISSANTGADTGTGIISQGLGKVQYASYCAASFIESELFRSPKRVVRGGLRGDVQTAEGVQLSPRLSAVAGFHGFVLKAGSGMFVQPWTNYIFLRVLENDGNHLQQFLIQNVSLSSDLGTATGVPVSEIVSKISPDLVATRNWISKISLEHAFGGFSPGVEYTWTDGSHLLGSQRLDSTTGWTDWLESNRAQSKHQVRALAQFRIRGQSLTARYEWIHSRDNTDGPFSFPAVQDDIRGERGPSSGMATHNLAFVTNLRIGKVFVLTMVDSWHSPLPLNITSGLDPEGNGLYTDRAGLPRNSGNGTDYNLMEMYIYRRFAVPKLFLRSSQKTYLDFNMKVLNVLGNKDYSSFGTVLGSPLLGQPLAAAPGRSYQLSFSFSH